MLGRVGRSATIPDFMRTYRRHEDSDVWHHCLNCFGWPPESFVERMGPKPPTGKLCEECYAKDAAGKCSEGDGPRG